jgi:hypothetical protein
MDKVSRDLLELGAMEMWTVVYIAPNKTMAESIKMLLNNEGVLVMLRTASFHSLGELGIFEILVPESEAEEAHEILSGALAK